MSFSVVRHEFGCHCEVQRSGYASRMQLVPDWVWCVWGILSQLLPKGVYQGVDGADPFQTVVSSRFPSYAVRVPSSVNLTLALTIVNGYVSIHSIGTCEGTLCKWLVMKPSLRPHSVLTVFVIIPTAGQRTNGCFCHCYICTSSLCCRGDQWSDRCRNALSCVYYWRYSPAGHGSGQTQAASAGDDSASGPKLPRSHQCKWLLDLLQGWTILSGGLNVPSDFSHSFLSLENVKLVSCLVTFTRREELVSFLNICASSKTWDSSVVIMRLVTSRPEDSWQAV